MQFSQAEEGVKGGFDLDALKKAFPRILPQTAENGVSKRFKRCSHFLNCATAGQSRGF